MPLAVSGFMTAALSAPLVACPDCDAIQAIPGGMQETRALCFQCGALLRSGLANEPDRALAFTLAAIPLFIAANCLPLMQLEGRGNRAAATVVGAIKALNDQHMDALAGLVLLTTILLPALQLASTAHLLLALRRPGFSGALARVFRVLEAVRPWTQIEILLLGILIGFGRLASVFHMVPGIGLACMIGFFLLDRATRASLDGAHLWERLSVTA